MSLYLYNTLTRKKEKFIPLKKTVGVYTCGPTVYNYAHLGNLRAYIFADILVRTLKYNGYRVKWVMNITDVGHLTDDADQGEDKMEKASQREKKDAWEIAAFYLRAFQNDLKLLNILPRSIECRATEHIKEQIELIKKLEKKGVVYRTKDGIYFNTAKIKDYGKLCPQHLKKLAAGKRIALGEKKNITDFALWKFSPSGKKRQMEWESPWGKGFPGWHIECSAMSMKYLGNHFDIHTGGIDHIPVHHTNEIAQSETATGEKFVNYWLHCAFLNIAGGKKMAKSQKNFLTLENATLKKGISPLAYRLAVLQTHYRKPMEYSEKSLQNAQKALISLYQQIFLLGKKKGKAEKKWQEKFKKALNDDLNTPQALAIVAELLKDEKLSAPQKLATILDFDKVLGLNFAKILKKEIPDKVKKMAQLREKARAKKDWPEADAWRKKIEEQGYLIKDLPNQHFSLVPKNF